MPVRAKFRPALVCRCRLRGPDNNASSFAQGFGFGRLADREVALLVDEPPLVEVAEHHPRRLLGEVRGSR